MLRLCKPGCDLIILFHHNVSFIRCGQSAFIHKSCPDQSDDNDGDRNHGDDGHHGGDLNEQIVCSSRNIILKSELAPKLGAFKRSFYQDWKLNEIETN